MLTGTKKTAGIDETRATDKERLIMIRRLNPRNAPDIPSAGIAGPGQSRDG